MLRTLEEAAHRRAWGNTEELLAIVAETLDALLRAFVQVNSNPNQPTRPSPPLRIPRPGREQPKAEAMTLGDLARNLLSGGRP